MKPSATSGGVNGPTSSMEHHLISDLDSELGSDVVEIVQDSRFKAQTMVDTAMQVWNRILESVWLCLSLDNYPPVMLCCFCNFKIEVHFTL